MLARMLARLLSRFAPKAMPAAALPEGWRVYAVGDVHGRLDCLLALETAIRAHAADAEPRPNELVVFLGDYVDRGPASYEVIEALRPRRFAGLPARHLLGNHEEAMLRFLDDPAIGPAWLSYGGLATLASYGVAAPASLPLGERIEHYRGELTERLPAAHRAFLQGLELSIELGGYLFVHAGVRPGLPLDQQDRLDLIEIREPFLSSRKPLPWRVVHGHTISQEPELLPHRVGIDTGAYASGRLTCAVIEGETVEFLTS